MAKLEGMSIAELRSALDRVNGAKPAMRLMMAIAYKDGVSAATLSERYDVPRSTVYYWLERLETGQPEAAAVDTSRPGRPPKLPAEHRQTVETWLSDAPTVAGVDAETWRPEVLRDLIRERFGVQYSVGHVRRLFFD